MSANSDKREQLLSRLETRLARLDVSAAGPETDPSIVGWLSLGNGLLAAALRGEVDHRARRFLEVSNTLLRRVWMEGKAAEGRESLYNRFSASLGVFISTSLLEGAVCEVAALRSAVSSLRRCYEIAPPSGSDSEDARVVVYSLSVAALGSLHGVSEYLELADLCAVVVPRKEIWNLREVLLSILYDRDTGAFQALRDVMNRNLTLADYDRGTVNVFQVQEVYVMRAVAEKGDLIQAARHFLGSGSG